MRHTYYYIGEVSKMVKCDYCGKYGHGAICDGCGAVLNLSERKDSEYETVTLCADAEAYMTLKRHIATGEIIHE